MSNIKPNLIKPNDYRKLKDSKPVKIVAHSHEVIVPVVYSSMVNKFLESKGIKLPLSHHELAKLKEKAKQYKGGPEPDPTKTVDDLYCARGSSGLSVNIKGKGADVLKLLHGARPTIKRRKIRGRIVKSKNIKAIQGQIDASKIWQAGTPANALRGWTNTLLSATPNPPKDIDKELEKQNQKSDERFKKILEEQEKKSEKLIKQILKRQELRKDLKTPLSGDPTPTIRGDPTVSSSSSTDTGDLISSSEEESEIESSDEEESEIESSDDESKAAKAASSSKEILKTQKEIIETNIIKPDDPKEREIVIIDGTLKVKELNGKYTNLSTHRLSQKKLYLIYLALDKKYKDKYIKVEEQSRGKKSEPGKKK